MTKRPKLPAVSSLTGLTADELRRKFISFYRAQGHRHQRSASLVPINDPTLLFTSAGMVQFKAYFEGSLEPPAPRIVTVQKCFRTTDIDMVGDTSHLTFFEMLGNFSFGDYFKEDACKWALELMCGELGFDPERLFYTVHANDDEARQIWLDLGITGNRIYACGDEDNWWGPAGGSGPCGPCSEIHVYHGDQAIPLGANPNSHPDFLELYNLVFTQFMRTEDGQDLPLKNKNIDTGMGLERVLAVINRVDSVYETDVLACIAESVRNMANKSCAGLERQVRIVTEHIRSAAFLIGDGVVPSNTGRGYVLRRILRRALDAAREFELKRDAPQKLTEVVASLLGDTYPELRDNGQFIGEVVKMEQDGFERVLKQGEAIFETVAAQTKTGVLPSTKAVELFDTHGLPLPLIKELAAKHRLSFDEREFATQMQVKAEKSRRAQDAVGGTLAKLDVYKRIKVAQNQFKGYETTKLDSTVKAIIRDGKQVDQAVKGEQVEVVLAETPFYAERGGQVGDSGQISDTNTGLVVAVHDTQSPWGSIHSHHAKVVEGVLRINAKVTAKVDFREEIRRNHTATHMLHSALREVVGKHVRQAGSVVHRDYLRFDFTHIAPLTDDTITEVEKIVNNTIRNNQKVKVDWTSFDKAIAGGALAFFGDRYDDEVRTIKIGETQAGEPWSYELCGGTHMEYTGGIGYFCITEQSGIGAGLRRVVALTGYKAEAKARQSRAQLRSICIVLKAHPAEASQKAERLLKENKTAQNERLSAKDRLLDKRTSLPVARAPKPAEFTCVFQGAEFTVRAYFGQNFDLERLRLSADQLSDSLTKNGKNGGVAMVCTAIRPTQKDGRPAPQAEPKLAVVVTKNLAGKSVHAGKLAKSVLEEIGGNGGGRPDFAVGGGGDTAKLKRLFKDAKKLKALVDKTL